MSRGIGDARVVLRAAGLTPKKGFGQNFLVAPDVARRIAEAAVPDAERGSALVVEIGAGTGALTAELAHRASRVIAIERDRDLVPLLRASFAEIPTVEIVEADAKTFDYRAFARQDIIAKPRDLSLVGNLPYQLTGALLERATEIAPLLVRAVFMVQREVGARLLAAPGTKDYGALTVFVRAAFDVARVMRVSAGSFFPRPDVESTVVILVPRKDRVTETETFRALVHAAFAKRRKTLRNAWSGIAEASALDAAARACAISLDARGETLSAEQFAAMALRLA